MHNFIKSDISITDSLNEVGFKLQNPKKDFFATCRERFEKLYSDYNEKAADDKLHMLTPEWGFKTSDDDIAKNDKIEKRKLAYGLYEAGRPFVKMHWERLKTINGGATLYCPICGLHECEDMDHFAPRDFDKFPEYSAHLNNLIPLCHNCNHKKWNKFLGDNGERLYFNAYYDTLTDRNILVGVITISPVDGLPQIEVIINPILSNTKVPDKYILSTIEDLKLMHRFNEKAKQWLKYEMVRISIRVGQPWQVIRNEMAKLATPIEGDPDIVHPVVLGAIASSSEMEAWYNTL